MKKCIALLLAALLALSMFTTAFAATYKDKATVKAVQQALNDAGYNCGTPDGSAGKKTKAAIESFQADHGLEVTREIDDALLEALGIAVDAPEAEAEPEAEPEAEAEAMAASTEDWVENPGIVVDLYNLYFMDRLSKLGVDVEGGEDVGQSAYMITEVELGWPGMFVPNVLSGEMLTIMFDYEGWEDESEWKSYFPISGELDFLQQASLYAQLMTLDNFFKSEGVDASDNGALLELLPDEADRDATAAIETPFEADCGGYTVKLESESGQFNVSAYRNQ